MKIRERIATEQYCYFEIEFDSFDEFKKDYDKVKYLIEKKINNGEVVPRCSICNQKMAKSSKGRYYCKHLEDGQVVWGEPVYPCPSFELSDKEKKFLEDLK